MVKFCDLPLEILLDIVERVPGSISSLSLACRYLNGVTARRLFQTYRLQLREKQDKGARVPRCFLTGRSLLVLHADGVEAGLRLGHLRKKAAIVRELRIVDYGQRWKSGGTGRLRGTVPPFDLTTLIPALVETLDGLDRVTSVVFETTDRSDPPAWLPDELWQWLSRCKPGKVSFDGYFAFPDPLEWLPPVVGYMSFIMNEEASRVLKVARPAHLDILVDTAGRKKASFKEIFEPYPGLERLDVRFQCYHDCIPRGYFDFTAHPEIRISIELVVADKDLYIEDPGAWEETEERLKEIFVDDFSKLDVHRDVGSNRLVVSRPLPGQKGGVRTLNFYKGSVDEENEETLLAFEQAVLAALPEEARGQITGPINAAFLANLDGVFAAVFSQTFEPLVQSVNALAGSSSSVDG